MIAPIAEEAGWYGAFTRNQVEGALANGSRIVKCNSERGDATPDGTPGVVLGSLCFPEVMDDMVFYFVEWANAPRCAVGCIAFKLRPQ